MNKIIAVLVFAFGCSASIAQAQNFEVGVNYDLLPIPVETADPSKIEVVEVFSYGCPHCFEFEPSIEAWVAKQPSDVQFRRLPAVFRKEWEMLAQAYYAAEVLGVVNKVNMPIFEAVHLKGLNPNDPAVLAAVFKESAGVDGEEFLKVLNSFGVRSKVLQADAQGRMYDLKGVPTLIVAGKYTVYGQNSTGANVDRLSVVDFLVAKERAARSQAKGAHAQ
jgi:protein dithiol oxidoreductase (disulfide-forming)